VDDQVPGVETVRALLDALRLERVYLACPAPQWQAVLHFARCYPRRLEGLLLLDVQGAPLEVGQGGRARSGAVTSDLALIARLPEITAPTAVLIEDHTDPSLGGVDLLVTRLPRCTKIVVLEADLSAAVPELSLQFGHAMMRFLVQCERQRNLVRGASFLL
jgi:hypothetical protein